MRVLEELTDTAEPAWPLLETELRGNPESTVLPLSYGIAVYSFMSTREAQDDLAATTRSPAPTTDLFGFQADGHARRAGEEPDHLRSVHIRAR